VDGAAKSEDDISSNTESDLIHHSMAYLLPMKIPPMTDSSVAGYYTVTADPCFWEASWEVCLKGTKMAASILGKLKRK
jgi:hypothetical protein